MIPLAYFTFTLLIQILVFLFLSIILSVPSVALEAVVYDRINLDLAVRMLSLHMLSDISWPCKSAMTNVTGV